MVADVTPVLPPVRNIRRELVLEVPRISGLAKLDASSANYKNVFQGRLRPAAEEVAEKVPMPKKASQK